MIDDAEAAELERAERCLGEVLLGRYRVEKVIGCGGVAVVFQALDAETGDLVAVKALRQDIAQVHTAGARFLREARIALSFHHPAVPRGIAAGTDAAGRPLIVMEFVSGEDYRSIIARGGRLRVPEALAVAARVADALDAAHRAGIVHRDIKPDNVMLLRGTEAPGGVCVLDFGLAHCLDEPRLSSTGMLCGSPQYMSPEQVRGEAVTPASDLYSLGATLVELLTGAAPYSGGLYQVMAAHATAPPPSLRDRAPEVPEAVERYVHRLLDKDPARRPPTAGEVGDALRALSRRHGSGRDASLDDTANDDALILMAGAPGGAALIERMHEQSMRLQSIVRSASAAKARLVEQLVAVSARRLERVGLLHERRRRGAAGDARGVASLDRQLAELGDDDADRALETRLEEDLAALQRHSLAEQDEVLAAIHDLRARFTGRPDGTRAG